MKKNIKFLLPVLVASLLLAMSSISCASNVKGKTFKHEKEDMTISFTTKSDFVFKAEGVETAKGTYKVAKKVITCKFTFKHPQTGEIISEESKFDIINAKKIKDEDGDIWNKV